MIKANNNSSYTVIKNRISAIREYTCKVIATAVSKFPCESASIIEIELPLNLYKIYSASDIVLSSSAKSFYISINSEGSA